MVAHRRPQNHTHALRAQDHHCRAHAPQEVLRPSVRPRPSPRRTAETRRRSLVPSTRAHTFVLSLESCSLLACLIKSEDSPTKPGTRVVLFEQNLRLSRAHASVGERLATHTTCARTITHPNKTPKPPPQQNHTPHLPLFFLPACRLLSMGLGSQAISAPKSTYRSGRGVVRAEQRRAPLFAARTLKCRRSYRCGKSA